MRFEVDKKVKAGLLFGLLAFGLARPTIRDRRELSEVSILSGIEARTPVIEPVIPKIGTPPKTPEPVTGPHIGGETPETPGGSNSGSGPHIGDDTPQTGSGSNSGAHIGDQTPSGSGTANSGAKYSGNLKPANGEKVWKSIGTKDDRSNYDYSGDLTSKNYVKEAGDGSVPDLSNDAKTWFKEKFNIDIANAESKKVQIWSQDKEHSYDMDLDDGQTIPLLEPRPTVFEACEYPYFQYTKVDTRHFGIQCVSFYLRLILIIT